MKKSITILLLSFTILCPMMTMGAFSAEAAYVGNAKTLKFHYEDCRWAKKMKEENKVYFETREGALEQGYVSCGSCNP